MAKTVLYPYQRRWVEDPRRLKLWLASRQIGKSFALACEAVRLALRDKCAVLILSASERQSREVMEKVLSHLRALTAIARLMGQALVPTESKTECRLPNGSRILSLPAAPNTVRGFSGHVFLDEFAFHEDARAIYRAMLPTMLHGYQLRIASTPNGRSGLFYELWKDEANGFARHRTTIHDAVADGLAVDLALLRQACPHPDDWAQEYECAFLDEATAWLSYELISACEVPGPRTEPPSGPLFLGVDIGRHRDLTVLWQVEQVGDVLWTREVRVLERAPFAVQREVLFSLLPSVRRACLDASGLGMQLAEEAQQRFGAARVEAVTFSGAVKEALAEGLRRRCEDRTVRIPDDRAIREDLHSVKRLVTATGTARFDADRHDRSHADRFWALALACAACPDPPVGPIEYASATRSAWRGPMRDDRGPGPAARPSPASVFGGWRASPHCGW